MLQGGAPVRRSSDGSVPAAFVRWGPRFSCGRGGDEGRQKVRGLLTDGVLGVTQDAFVVTAVGTVVYAAGRQGRPLVGGRHFPGAARRVGRTGRACLLVLVGPFLVPGGADAFRRGPGPFPGFASKVVGVGLWSHSFLGKRISGACSMISRSVRNPAATWPTAQWTP